MIIYPAIDIIGGQCVRLTEGLYDTKKVYHEDPVEMAGQFEAAGFTHLHMVDLDGAKAGNVINASILKEATSKTSLSIDFGGGIRKEQDLINVFDAGAKQANVGSLAVKNPELIKQWIDQYGPAKIILSADVKDGKIAVHGWQDQSEIALNSFIQDYLGHGIEWITCTDISKDGQLSGASVELYKEILSQFPAIKLIASGGVDSLENVEALQDIGCYGAIVGKAIYEQKITLEDLVKYNEYAS